VIGDTWSVSDVRNEGAPSTTAENAWTLWVPLAASSVATSAAVLWLAQWLLALSLLSSAMPEGLRVVRPPDAEIALLVTRQVAVPVLAVVAVFVAWRFGLRGRAKHCWIASAAAVALSVASILS
jgi:hypothetical protein